MPNVLHLGDVVDIAPFPVKVPGGYQMQKHRGRIVGLDVSDYPLGSPPDLVSVQVEGFHSALRMPYSAVRRWH